MSSQLPNHRMYHAAPAQSQSQGGTRRVLSMTIELAGRTRKQWTRIRSLRSDPGDHQVILADLFCTELAYMATALREEEIAVIVNQTLSTFNVVASAGQSSSRGATVVVCAITTPRVIATNLKFTVTYNIPWG